MKITLKKEVMKNCLLHSITRSSWRSRLLLAVSLLLVVVVSSLSSTLCVYFPMLMRLRSNACQVWKDVNFVTQGTLQWWQYICVLEKDWDVMDYKCSDTRLMGNWPVCFDQPFSPVQLHKPCIVYSFGIAYDFRFDDAIALHNCTVYSFDPSMNTADHKHAPGIYFKRLGIGAQDNENFIPRIDGYASEGDRWRIMKLGSIMKGLGHTPDTVSLIKMDVEGHEWAILANLLEEKILPKLRQILIEWHIFTDSPPVTQYSKMYNDYNTFRSLGFDKFWMKDEGRSHWLPKMHSQAETAFVNTRFQKPRRRT